MKERPIIFNAEMVRAILDGRKTQTRRIVANVQPDNCLTLRKPTKTKGGMHTHVIDAPKHDLCPFGKVGDRLWVRETWWQAGYGIRSYPEADEFSWCGSRRVHYAADGNPPNEPNSDYPKGLRNGNFSAAAPNTVWKKRPSIHMPRWASRIMLEITDARVELLNSISDDDARAEGVAWSDGAPNEIFLPTQLVIEAKDEFTRLWKSIYGEDSWRSNPWVWVIEFKRVEGGAA